MFFLFVTCLGASAVVSDDCLGCQPGDVLPYDDWVQKFRHRTFDLSSFGLSSDEAVRRETYNNNVKFIKEQNALYSIGEVTHRLGVNQFADLSNAEYRQVMHLDEINLLPEDPHFTYLAPSDTATSIDWRVKGGVTKVKNQGSCGSCWSFSATGAIEGAVFAATSTLVSLSEKQLMDCSRSYGNDSCSGGFMYRALQYVADNGGIDTEEDYPYVPRDGNCQKSKEARHVAAITGFQRVPKYDPDQMATALNLMPVSIGIDAGGSVFQHYRGGVVTNPACGDSLNHGVLMVGYTGTDNASYPNAWIVKNSWDSTWGVDGYIYITRSTARDRRGICGVLSEGIYATGASLPGHPTPPPGPHPTPTPPPPSDVYYENPFLTSCQSNEFNITTGGDWGAVGSICAPTCGHDTNFKCPDAPQGSEGVPLCKYTDHMSNESFCALGCGETVPCNLGMKCLTSSDTNDGRSYAVCLFTGATQDNRLASRLRGSPDGK